MEIRYGPCPDLLQGARGKDAVREDEVEHEKIWAIVGDGGADVESWEIGTSEPEIVQKPRHDVVRKAIRSSNL